MLMGTSEKTSKEGLALVGLVRVTRVAWGRQLEVLSSQEALVGPRPGAWAVDGWMQVCLIQLGSDGVRTHSLR